MQVFGAAESPRAGRMHNLFCLFFCLRIWPKRLREPVKGGEVVVSETSHSPPYINAYRCLSLYWELVAEISPFSVELTRWARR